MYNLINVKVDETDTFAPSFDNQVQKDFVQGILASPQLWNALPKICLIPPPVNFGRQQCGIYSTMLSQLPQTLLYF